MKMPDAEATYPNDLVLCARSEVASIGTEAYTANIQIGTSHRVRCIVIFQDADLLASIHIKDLRGFVAASGDIFAIMAKSNTAHDTVV